MTQVNVLDAKNNLSRMLRSLEDGTETSFVIARNGKPIARLVPYSTETESTRRIGVAHGKTLTKEGWDLDSCNDEVASMFEGDL